MIQTDQTANEKELRELFDWEEDEALPECVPVCDGEWRREGEVRWRFYRNE